MLLVKTSNLSPILDPRPPPPDTEQLIPSFRQGYSELFVLMMALNGAAIPEARVEDAVDVISHVEEDRIFMNGPPFTITMTTFSDNVVVAMVFYAQAGTTLVLPRLPTTVGSVIAHIAPSLLVTEGRTSEDDATYS